jgi:hypothetical protein
MMAVEDTEPAPPKRKYHRRRKYPDTPLVGDIDQSTLGPAMLALSPQRQRFVAELCFGPAGYGSEIRAARCAGWTGNEAALKVTASRALEVGFRQIRAASLNAIRNIEAIANDLTNPAVALKANLALIDRAGLGVETVHTMKVEHSHHVAIDAQKALERIRELAVKAGVPALPAPAVIDVEAEEISDDN